jgi:hypothetical protein
VESVYDVVSIQTVYGPIFRSVMNDELEMDLGGTSQRYNPGISCVDLRTTSKNLSRCPDQESISAYKPTATLTSSPMINKIEDMVERKPAGQNLGLNPGHCHEKPLTA